MELLAHEKDALGLYLSGHPIDRHAENLRAFGAKTVGDLTMTEIPPSTDGSPGRLIIEDVYVGGIVSGFRGLKTKKGDPMCVFTLEDHQGAVEVVVFPEMFGKHRMLIENGALLLVRGKALSVSVFTALQEDADADWLRAATLRWVDDLLRLNSR